MSSYVGSREYDHDLLMAMTDGSSLRWRMFALLEREFGRIAVGTCDRSAVIDLLHEVYKQGAKDAESHATDVMFRQSRESSRNMLEAALAGVDLAGRGDD